MSLPDYSDEVTDAQLAALRALVGEPKLTPVTPGQLAYEADVAKHPEYRPGWPRRTWAQLDDLARSSWEKNPTPRGGK